jgi:hypothetical protein
VSRGIARASVSGTGAGRAGHDAAWRYVVDVNGRFDSVPPAAGQIGDVDLLVIGGDLTTGGSTSSGVGSSEALRAWRVRESPSSAHTRRRRGPRAIVSEAASTWAAW